MTSSTNHTPVRMLRKQLSQLYLDTQRGRVAHPRVSGESLDLDLGEINGHDTLPPPVDEVIKHEKLYASIRSKLHNTLPNQEVGEASQTDFDWFARIVQQCPTLRDDDVKTIRHLLETSGSGSRIPINKLLSALQTNVQQDRGAYTRNDFASDKDYQRWKQFYAKQSSQMKSSVAAVASNVLLSRILSCACGSSQRQEAHYQELLYQNRTVIPMMTLLSCTAKLIRQCNPKCAVRSSGLPDTLVSNSIIIPSAVADALSYFSCLYVGTSRPALMYQLTMLCHNPCLSATYLEQVASRLHLLAEETNCPWTVSESKQLRSTCSFVFYLTSSCVANYQSCFHHLTLREEKEALQHCLHALRVSRNILREVTQSDKEELLQPWAEFIDCLCESAIVKRYYDILAQAKETDERVVAPCSTIDTVVKEGWFSRLRRKSRGGKQVTVVDPMADFEPTMKTSKEELGILRVHDKRHMIRVLDAVNAELQADIELRTPIFQSEVKGYRYAMETSQAYFPLIWSDFQLLLRLQHYEMKKELEKGGKNNMFGQSIFVLYRKLSEFYDTVAQYTDQPPLELQSWFEPFIDSWIGIQRHEFLDVRLPNVVHLDVDRENDFCTSSLYDLFRLLYPLQTIFELAPYTQKQAVDFAQLLADVVQGYVQAQFDAAVALSKQICVMDRKGEIHAEIPLAMLKRFNNILTSRVKLRELLVDIRIQERFAAKKRLGSHQYRRCHNTLEMDALKPEDFSMEERDLYHIEDLLCMKTFHYMDDCVDRIGRLCFGELEKPWKKWVDVFLDHQPFDELFQDDEVDVIMEPFWSHLIQLIQYIQAHVTNTTFLLLAIMEKASLLVESILLQTKWKRVLSFVQLERLGQVFRMVKETLSMGGLSTSLMDAIKPVIRVEFLLSLFRAETCHLITMDKAGLFQPGSERQRTAQPPYMDERHLRAQLMHRARALHDAAAEEHLHT